MMENDFKEIKSKGFEEVGVGTNFPYQSYLGARVFPRRLQFTKIFAQKMIKNTSYWRVLIDDEKMKIMLIPSTQMYPHSRMIHEYGAIRGDRPNALHYVYVMNISLNLPRTNYLLEEEKEDGSIILSIEQN